MADLAFEPVHQRDDVVIDTAVRDGFDDHGEDVHADTKFFRDHARIDIVAGILPQLGHPGLGVADPDFPRLPLAPKTECDKKNDDEHGRHRFQALGQPCPKRVGLRAAVDDPLGVGGRQTQIREQDGQQEEICDDDHRHAQTGGDGEFVNRRDFYHHHRDETDDVRHQRDDAGDDETLEGEQCGRRAIVTGENLIAEGADFLNAMAHADRKHEERDQNRKRVDPKAERGQAAQLPDDGDEGANDGGGGKFPAPGVFPDEQSGD